MNSQNIISDLGKVNLDLDFDTCSLGLRSKYAQYEQQIRRRLIAAAKYDGKARRLSVPHGLELSTDNLTTVGLSLAKSVSTGIIQAYLFQGDFIDDQDTRGPFRTVWALIKRDKKGNRISNKHQEVKSELKLPSCGRFTSIQSSNSKHCSTGILF